MRRRLGWLVSVTLVAAACSGSGSDAQPDPPQTTAPPTPTSTTTAAPVSTTTATAPVEGDSVDRLVVIDSVGNILTVRPDGTDVQALTDNAGQSTVYFQPQWAPGSGRIVWSEARADGFAVVTSDASGGNRTSSATSAMPFFFAWSPDAQRVGVLHNSPAGGLDLEVVDVEGASSEVVATGAPFYFSWSPDGSRIATHVGGQDDLLVVEINGDSVGLASTERGYQAPQWTPAGIYHLDAGAIRLQEAGGASRPVLTVPGPVTFVANADGSRIAVQALVQGQAGIDAAFQSTPVVAPNVVAVLDVATGEVDVATSRPALGYFWSPDGESLLITVSAPVQGALDWLVWKDGETTRLGTFFPPVQFVRDVLQFFNQYAQSLRLWSPDSSSFAFAGEIEGKRGIWVQAIDGSEPRFVIEGSWVSWSTS